MKTVGESYMMKTVHTDNIVSFMTVFGNFLRASQNKDKNTLNALFPAVYHRDITTMESMLMIYGITLSDVVSYADHIHGPQLWLRYFWLEPHRTDILNAFQGPEIDKLREYATMGLIPSELDEGELSDELFDAKIAATLTMVLTESSFVPTEEEDMYV